MKIEHYISQLLYRYQCVTIPGFGAFLTEIQSAQLKKENNGFYPPKKLVSFNAFLKNNDGLLANHIAQAEKITYETAVQNIQKEVSLWKNALQNYCCLNCKHQAAYTHRLKIMLEKSKSIKELLNKIYYN
jgi:hypothetical protein